jgi:inorganic pyrophosphatase
MARRPSRKNEMNRKSLLDLPPFSEEGDLHVVIETARGSGTKFKYRADLDLFTVHRVLPRGLLFPHAFGFIPSTRGEDGDPLDVMFLSETDVFPGCLARARLVGVIRAAQKENGKTAAHDRLIAVDPLSPAWSRTKRIGDVPAEWLAEIEHFFASYRRPAPIEFSVTGRGNFNEALDLVRDGIARARKKARPGARSRR